VALEVVEGQGVDDVANGSRKFRVGYFKLPHTIGETIAQRRFHRVKACRPALKHCLNFPSQAVQSLSGICIKVVRLGELRAETCHQRPEGLF
jgi:hypothetical protein